MARQSIIEGDSGLQAKNKLDNNFIELYEVSGSYYDSIDTFNDFSSSIETQLNELSSSIASGSNNDSGSIYLQFQDVNNSITQLSSSVDLEFIDINNNLNDLSGSTYSQFLNVSSSIANLTSDHNSTTGKQGGVESQYYHLTESEHTIAIQSGSATQSGYISSVDWNVFNEKGEGITQFDVTVGDSSISGEDGDYLNWKDAIEGTTGNVNFLIVGGTLDTLDYTNTETRIINIKGTDKDFVCEFNDTRFNISNFTFNIENITLNITYTSTAFKAFDLTPTTLSIINNCTIIVENNRTVADYAIFNNCDIIAGTGFNATYNEIYNCKFTTTGTRINVLQGDNIEINGTLHPTNGLVINNDGTKKVSNISGNVTGRVRTNGIVENLILLNADVGVDQKTFLIKCEFNTFDYINADLVTSNCNLPSLSTAYNIADYNSNIDQLVLSGDDNKLVNTKIGTFVGSTKTITINGNNNQITNTTTEAEIVDNTGTNYLQYQLFDGTKFTKIPNSINIDAGTGISSELKLTNGTTSGTSTTDGTGLRIETDGTSTLVQYENLPLNIKTNNTTQLSISELGVLTATNLIGIGNRMVQSSSTGVITASEPIIAAKLSDTTAISLLINTANWSDTTGGYIGTALTGTYEGQYYSDASFFYFCYSDNTFLRIDIRASVSGKLTDSTTIALLINAGNWTGVNYTGTTITDTFEGMYYNDGTYKYEAYSDNVWFRTALV